MRDHSSRDRGAVLPLVLILTVVLGALAAAIATYTTTALRTTTVTSARVHRLADAEGGMRRALASLAATGTCPTGGSSGPNGSTVAVSSCETQLLSGSSTTQNFGLVLTGLGLPSSQTAWRRYDTNSAIVNIGGEVFVAAGATGNSNMVVANNGARVQRTNCTGYLPEPSTWLMEPVPNQAPRALRPTCTTQGWQAVSPAPTTLTMPTVAGSFTGGGSTCRVYQPGVYSLIDIPNHSKTYFRSGVYLIDASTFTLRGDISAGYFPNGGVISPTDPNSACRAAQQIDIDDGGPGGVVFVLANDASINFTNQLISFDVYGYLSGNRIFSVIAAPAGMGLPVSTRPPTGSTPIINNSPTPEYRFMGEVWAPGSFIDPGNLSSGKAGRGFIGGLTASRFEFRQTGGASGGLSIISLDIKVHVNRHRLTVTATDTGGGTTKVSAVARRTLEEFELDSWRVH